jgi:hypothetical protein
MELQAPSNFKIFFIFLNEWTFSIATKKLILAYVKLEFGDQN